MRAMRLLFGPASVLQMQANANSNDGNDVNLKVTNMHPTTCYRQSVLLSGCWTACSVRGKMLNLDLKSRFHPRRLDS